MVLSPIYEGIVVGAMATAAAMVSYANLRGVKLLPVALENIQYCLGNITILEAWEIFSMAAKYSKDGFTPDEAQALGKKIIDAAAEK